MAMMDNYFFIVSISVVHVVVSPMDKEGLA
jgi:hypothetical protein